MLIPWDMIAQSQPLTVVIVACLGLCVGSFLNVVIYRTPLIMRQTWRADSAYFWQGEADLPDTHKHALLTAIKHDAPLSLSFPPSRCPTCQYRIRFYENIPLISWLILRGKCASCCTPISARYPLVELGTALLSVGVIVVLGTNMQGLAALLFTWLLIALAGIDFDTQLLPDRLVYPLGMLGLALNTQELFVSPVFAIWGALMGFLSLWSVASLYALIKKRQGMGYGDFKLLGAIGAWLGVGMLPFVVLLSSLLGTIIGGAVLLRHKQNRPFAFGPYIAIAGVVALLFGNDLMHWYWQLLGLW